MFQKTSIEGVSSVKPARNKIESDCSTCSCLRDLFWYVILFNFLVCCHLYVKKNFFIKFPYYYAIFYCHAFMDFVQTVFLTQIYCTRLGLLASLGVSFL